MSCFERAAELLPPVIRKSALAMPADVRNTAQELRLRLGRTPSVSLPDGEKSIPGCEAVIRDDLARTVEIATRASPYAAARGIRRGYVTAPGAIRVGLCGQMEEDAGESWIFSGLSSVSIRIPGEIKGCGARFCRPDMASSLILSPPGAGKTTLLRDMVRLISDAGQRVGLCDERGEVAALTEQSFGFDVGEHTDVITGCAKGRAAMMMLRNMTPRWIAMDEITDPADAAACEASFSCGVRILATAHACSGEDLRRNRLYVSLLSKGIFRRLIWIRQTDGRRIYSEEML